MNAPRLPRVFVVDDTETNIDILLETLGSGYEVGVALDGESALEDIPPSRPDLVLLDVMMPGIDGYEVAQRLKADPETRDIPIIFITAQGDAVDETRGFAVGAVDYIAKPFSPAVVRARVRTHLQLREARAQLARQNEELEVKVRCRTAALERQSRELSDTRREIIRRLGRAAEFKDNETGLHVIRMSHFTAVLARQAGLAPEQVELLAQAAPMHDVGKIGIPDRILLKPGRLDEAEMGIMKRHPEIGAGIIGQHESRLLESARMVALTHHERWDGLGYPAGLSGTDIPICGRIVAVADVFDALTSTRPYKAPWSITKAMEWLAQGAGTQFDPDLIPLFAEAMPEILEIRERWKDEEPAEDPNIIDRR